jgi:capsular exopolysaccharide synthesis family protein
LDTNKPLALSQEQSNNKNELWNLSFRDLFYKYVRFLPLFVISVAVALLIAYAYLRYTVPIYSVGGTMLIKSEQQGGNNKLEDMFSTNKGLNIQSEIEILKARPLMQRVVDSLNLQFSYHAIGKIKTVNVYKYGGFIAKAHQINDSSRSFTLKIKVIDDDRFRVNDDKTVVKFGQQFKNMFGEFTLFRTSIGLGKEYKITWTPSSAAAGAYAGALQILPRSPGTGILNISMRSPNPQLAADIINGLMDQYGNYSVEQKNRATEQQLVFISARLAEYEAKLDSIQRIVSGYQERNKIIDVKTQLGSYFDEIAKTDALVNEQTFLLNQAEDIENYLRDKKNQFSKAPVPTSLGVADATLVGLIGEYNKAQIARQQLLDANIPESNPAVQEADGVIEKLRVSILENLRIITASVNSTISTLKKRNLVNQSQLTVLPARDKELLEMQRKVEAYQAMYKLFLEEGERANITKAATTANSSIVDRAYPSSIPVKPNKRAIQILAILLGLGIPALVIFISEILNDKITTRFDIEKITSAPILGEIGHSYSDNTLVVNKTTRSMVAEQFRIIRSNLQYILNKQEKSIILVTSSFSGEGKSYVTTNMGAVLALAGKKTIILEFDIRKPKILSGLGMPKGPGATNYLIGKSALPDLIVPVPGQENLFVLGCGPIPPNPSELLLDQKVEEMFAWLRTNFDIVLVDTAPVGMVSDAMTLGKFADCTLYLVRQGHTFKKQIALIDEFYKESKLPKVSVIINDVKLKPGYGYYGYGRYGYGYGYGYGSYYEEETPPANVFERMLNWLDIRKFFGKKKKNRRS